MHQQKRFLQQSYLNSTVAPASSSCFCISSASSLLTPSLTAEGASSTSALASFKPRPVIARTALITFTFLSPAAVSITSTSVFSSALPPAASPPPAAGAATATGADADTPNFSSMSAISSTTSITLMSAIAFNTSSFDNDMSFLLIV
uniref:50S ribosomal protein L7/L12 n=1 Tax=uncultured gamma proteobacterium HF0010_01E20 TaxID=710977 RepID=E0XQ66_9GAMM|nr:hypothetical protein [uncultured gamma proteobacterium HF0010_01E20]